MKANIVGVCTKESSRFNSDFADLVPICKTNNIPYIFVDDINSKNNVNWVKTLNPDIIFCFGWSSLIKKELLDLPPMGIVGYHPTKLPQNRGRHPLIWSLVLGLKKSASTFFFMTEKADDGDILSQEEFDIFDDYDANILYNKVISIASNQIEMFMPQLENNTYIRKKQDSQLKSTWRKRTSLDGLIDFRMNSKTIYNLVRGLTKPYIGATICYNNTDVSIWKVKIKDNTENNIEPGKIIEVINNNILVKTYDGSIWILEHEFKVLPKVGEYL
jgi:methionyl-tRNA formyltransferase